MQKFKETFTAGDGSQLVRATFTVGPYVGGPSLAGVHNPRETWNNWAMPFLTFDGVVELAEKIALFPANKLVTVELADIALKPAA